MIYNYFFILATIIHFFSRLFDFKVKSG